MPHRWVNSSGRRLPSGPLPSRIETGSFVSSCSAGEGVKSFYFPPYFPRPHPALLEGIASEKLDLIWIPSPLLPGVRIG